MKYKRFIKNKLATTHSAQEVISSAEQLFEGFVADYYLYLDLTECMEWIQTVMEPFKNENDYIDDFICEHGVEDVVYRLLDKIIHKQDDDREILENYLRQYNTKQLGVLYYKNNIRDFIKDHDEIKTLILNIFENIENYDYVDKHDSHWLEKIPKEFYKDFFGKTQKDWNKFVNTQYFMNPNDVPDTISDDLFVLKNFLMKYVYCQYLSMDRIYRLKNFKRGVVTVIDTDSNILSLDPLVHFIKDEVVQGRTFGRSVANNDYICVNMIAYVLTSAVTDTLLTFGKFANIPEEYRPIYNMKNEFLFNRLIIGETKKRYISKIILREGNLLNPPKSDVKGFDLKKATTSDEAEAVFMKIINKHIIDPQEINIKGILKELYEFKKEIITSIRTGETRFLPNLNAKEFAAYKNPASQASVRGVLAWNMLFSEDQIYLPAKVRALKLNIFTEEDMKDLAHTHPEYYNIIEEKIFNDTTDIFVKRTVDPGIRYVSTNDKKWTEKIPQKYRTKYKKKGPVAWNQFVDDCEKNGVDMNEHVTYDKKGMQIIAIPTNEKIPEWLQPYIDIHTIVNDILAPIYPVLKIFKIKTVEEGRTRNGTNRKTNTISNIIKF